MAQINDIDAAILALTEGRELPPAVRIAFEGAMGVDDIHRIHDQLRGIEIIAPHRATPIEFMRLHPNQPLADYQYLAACKFREDFDTAHSMSSGVTNYARGEMYDTDLARADRARGYHGKGASRSASAGGHSDARLMAMHRRGAFAGIYRMSFWLAEAVIGFEIWPKAIADHWGEDQKYVGRRFREALDDLASFYRMHVRGPNQGRGQVWHAPDAE